jgi:K+-sensing histidine kinase KdpD
MLQGKSVKTGDVFMVNAMEQSVKQVKKMAAMINGFLNVSRLESGKINIDKQRFDMAELVKESEQTRS